MLIYCVDDHSLHLKLIQHVVEKACEMKGCEDVEIVACQDGEELLRSSEGKKVNLLTLDINMPRMDGLTSLIKFKAKNPLTPVLMASSENEKIVKRLTASDHSHIDDKKKEELLGKVIERVKSGQVIPGKINSILEACSELGMDPEKIALQHGAQAFLRKPYDVEASAEVLSKYLIV